MVKVLSSSTISSERGALLCGYHSGWRRRASAARDGLKVEVVEAQQSSQAEIAGGHKVGREKDN